MMKPTRNLLSLTLALLGLAGAAQAAVVLGTAGSYGVLSSTFTHSGGPSSIDGDVGYTTSGGSATFSQSGAIFITPTQAGNDQGAAQIALDSMAADFSFPAGATDLAADLTHLAYGGSLAVYVPGTYVVNGDMSIAGGATITLSGAGVYNFRTVGGAAGTFNTSDNSQVLLTNGADACDVFWTPSGATTLGASTIFLGTIIDDANITAGANTVWKGRALAFGGTVTLDTITINAPCASGSPTSTPTSSPSATPSASPTASPTATRTASRTASPTVTTTVSRTSTPTSTPSASPSPTPALVTLGESGNYGVLASTFTRNGGITAISGDAGYTTLSGNGTHTVTGTDHIPAPSQAGLDQAAALSAMGGRPCTFSFLSGAIDLASDTTHGSLGVYTPGTYCVTGAMNISGGGAITLLGKGIYVFRSTGAFGTSNNSRVMLSGGAVACDVFWLPGQATTLGADTAFVGTVIDDYGITVGSTTAWQGRALAFGGTITMDTDSIVALSCATPVGYTGPKPPDKGKTFVFPSPAKGHLVNIVYNMQEPGKVAVSVFNENGDLVAKIDENKPKGPQKSQIPIHDFAAGIYLYNVTQTYDSGAVEKSGTQKFAVVK